MTTATFDSREFINELTGSGMPERQAEAVVRTVTKVMDANLATKADIELIHKDMEILRKDMSVMKRDIIIWLGGAIIAATTIVINFMPVAAP